MCLSQSYNLTTCHFYPSLPPFFLSSPARHTQAHLSFPYFFSILEILFSPITFSLFFPFSFNIHAVTQKQNIPGNCCWDWHSFWIQSGRIPFVWQSPVFVLYCKGKVRILKPEFSWRLPMPKGILKKLVNVEIALWMVFLWNIYT